MSPNLLTIQKEQQAKGVPISVAPYNQRTAELNANHQNDQHAAQFAANQLMPLDEKGSGQLAPPVGKVPIGSGLQNAQNTYTNKAGGFQSSVGNLGQAGDLLGFNPAQGPVQVASGSEQQQNAIDRMRAAGISDAQIRANINNPAFNSRTSYTGQFDPSTNMYIPSAADKLKTFPAERDAKIAAAGGNAFNVSQQLAQQEAELKAQAAKDAAANVAGDQGKLDAGVKTTPQATPPSGQPNGNTGAPVDGMIDTSQITDPSMLMMANALNAQTKILNQNQANDLKAGQTALDMNKTNADAQSKLIADNKATTDANNALIQKNQDDQLARDKENLAKQEAAAHADLQYAEQQSLMQTSTDGAAAADAMIAKLAITGGTGSSGGLAGVSATRFMYTSKMDDIRRQFGVDGADIHAKFADLYIKVTDKYTSDTNQNIKDTNIALQTTLGQKLANNAAKATADAKVLSDFQTQQDKNSTERATAMVNGAKEMSSILTAQQDRKDKKAQQILDNKYRDTVHEDAVKAREDALAASIQTHKDALAASTLLHSDAATAHRDAAAIAETDKQATAGRAMRDKFATSIKTDPEIVPYDEFNNNIYARFQALTKDGKLTTANPETAVMLTDLFANANNPKLTARMPTQVVDLYNSNLSPTDKAKKFMDNFMGGGNMNARMMTDMTNALDDIHTKLQENAQNALDVYTLRAIHENSLMPAGYRYLGIDKSTLEHGDLNVLTDLGNSDSSSNVQSGQSDGDIFNGVPAKPNTTSFNPKTDLQVAMVGDKNVTAQPYVVNALQQADDALFAATGQHIQVNESYRDTAAQTAVYNKLSKTGGRVAPPGQSFHEKGLAVDIANWKESAPYLAKFGLVNGLKDDMGHFSVGEMNPTFAFQSSQS